MPAAIDYQPDSREIRMAAEAELRARHLQSQRAWRYYRGEHRPHLKIGADGVDDNVVLNLCRQAVDRTLAFLVPDFPTLQLDDDPLGDNLMETYLREVWRQNDDATLLTNLALNGALNGHVVARLMPPNASNLLPRIVNMNPAHVIAFWAGDDLEQVLWYELRWAAGRTAYRQDIIDEGGRWRIRQLRLQGSRWEEMATSIWRYPLGPFVDWQHQPHPTEYYGRDELAHAELNDLVNKIASDIARILRFHAYPRTIGTGFEATQVQTTGIDDFWVIPDKEAHVKNLEMQSDLSASLKFMEVLTDHFLAESRVVMTSSDPNAFRNMTNLGIRARHMDLIAKTAQLRRQYAKGIEAISRRVLMLGGIPLREALGAVVRVHWGEPLPIDRREEVELVEKQLALGLISPRDAAAELGLENPPTAELSPATPAESDGEGVLVDDPR